MTEYNKVKPNVKVTKEITEEIEVKVETNYAGLQQLKLYVEEV